MGIAPRRARELRQKASRSTPTKRNFFMRQPAREKGVDIVTAFGASAHRPRIRSFSRSANVHPGVIVSSSLAAISLLEDKKATLLARLSGVALTTSSCAARALWLSLHGASAQRRHYAADAVEEIYPVAAYYQDTWGEGIGSVRVAGLGARRRILCAAAGVRVHCKVSSLLHGAVSDGRLPHDARPLADREADGLVG